MRNETGVLLAVAAGLWPILLMLLIWHPGWGHGAARIAVLLLVLATAFVTTRHAPTMLLSPLFILGAVSAVFFSLIPWFTLSPALDGSRPLPPAILASARDYLEGTGEYVVLQFSAACLLLSVVLVRFIRPTRAVGGGERPIPDDRPARRIAVCAVALILLGSMVYAARMLSEDAERWLSYGIGREILHGTPPLLAVAVVALFHCAVARERRWLVLALGATGIAALALASTIMAKASVFIAFAGFGAYVVRSRPSGRRIALFAAGCGTVLVVALVILNIVRVNAVGDPLRFQHIYDSAVSKVLLRQTVTANCLQGVIDAAAPKGSGSNPLYFMASIVPRAVWPEKPNLSLGDVYGSAYCSLLPEKFSEKIPHSASISLLGEPIIHAGWAGLAVAQMSLMAVLAVLTWAAYRSGLVGSIGLAAMLPWLVDFDQSFALYVANAVKMFVWMIPLLAGMGLILRSSYRETPVTGAAPR